MQIEQSRWSQSLGWEKNMGQLSDVATLVLVFGSRSILSEKNELAHLRQCYPHAALIGCSTSGEIYGTEVRDETLVATALHFEKSEIKTAHVELRSKELSHAAGLDLAQQLPQENLQHVLVFAEGLQINGSALVQGITQVLPPNVTVTGGLSGDGALFQETLVLYNEKCSSGLIAAVGIYGTKMKIGYASLGGWDPFGPERVVTKAEGNTLYELDHEPALDLYKRYLGDQAEGLPATGLLFPLSVRANENTILPVVRTILSIDEKNRSITFAGNISTGDRARLMKANFDRLIDGAIGAASASSEAMGSTSPELALLISCVGRKLILKQRIEEEVEGVRDVLGASAILAGFYSYGEISPFAAHAQCELHNQTMTITTFREE